MALGRSCRGGDLERAMTSWWRLEASAFSSGEVRRGVGTTGAASADGGASAEARGRSTFSSARRVLAGDLDGRKVRGMLGARVGVLCTATPRFNLLKHRKPVGWLPPPLSEDKRRFAVLYSISFGACPNAVIQWGMGCNVGCEIELLHTLDSGTTHEA